MPQPRLALTLVAVPLFMAVLVNLFSVGLDKAYGGRGPDADEVLVWASFCGAALVASVVASWSARGGRAVAESLWLGLAAGVLTFVLSWVPLAVVLMLYPPT